MGKITKKETPPDVEVFFDGRDCGYWFRIADRYLKLGAKDVRMHLRTQGLRDDLYWKGLREVDYPLWRAQMDRIIDYAGPLAGHRVGIFQNSSGRRFLVTDEPAQLWAECPKRCKKPAWFLRFVEELLPGDQSNYFYHWLKIALVSARRGDFRPGQVVVLAGPSQCGKSLLQQIVSEVLGGRSANPFRYMMGETQFNYDLAWAEHWLIEDPASTTDIRTRRLFGSKLKECTVNRDFSIHQKGKDALLLPVFRRVTLSTNDEPENLAVIPPMDASIADKVFLFKCQPADVGEDRKVIWDTVLAETKLIRAWLLNLPEIEASLADARFGIRAWHHPDLLRELSDLSPEARLLTLMDAVLFPPPDPLKEEADVPDMPVHYKALDLEKKLRESAFGFEVDKLLKYSSACGTYLGRLSKTSPGRISKAVKDGYTLWTINPPSKEVETTA